MCVSVCVSVCVSRVYFVAPPHIDGRDRKAFVRRDVSGVCAQRTRLALTAWPSGRAVEHCDHFS